MRFCAICTAESADLVDWDDDGKHYRICPSCNDDQATLKHGPERGYEVCEGASQERISASADRVLRNQPRADFGNTLSINAKLSDRTPGWILVRIPTRGRDLREALSTLKHQRWFSELRILGSSNGFHLFERPDPRIAKAQRTPSGNPLAAIRAYRVGGGE